MWRFLTVGLLALAMPLGLSGQCYEAAFRVGYLYPSSRVVRDIFPKGWLEYQLEGGYYFCRAWQAWGNVGVGCRTGRSTDLHQKTDLTLVPVSAGLAYTFSLFQDASFRLGAGASYSFLRTKNDNDFVEKQLNKGTVGWVVKSNARFYFCSEFFFDIFCDYNYSVFHYKGSDPTIQRFDLDLSGLRAGLGFGLDF